MWLKISFFPEKPSILAAVALDGNLYFKASHVGKFLGYSCIYSFAQRHATFNLYKMIPSRNVENYNARQVFRVMSLKDLIDIARKAFRRGAILFSEKDIERLLYVWDFGVVSSNALPKELPVYSKFAFPLNVREIGEVVGSGNKILFRDWLCKFTEATLKMFAENQKIAEQCSRVICDYYVKVDSNTKIKIENEEKTDIGCTGKVACLTTDTTTTENDDSKIPKYLLTPPPSVKTAVHNASDTDINTPNYDCSLWNPSTINEEKENDSISQQPSTSQQMNVDQPFTGKDDLSLPCEMDTFSGSEDNDDNLKVTEETTKTLKSVVRAVEKQQEQTYGIFEMKYDGLVENFPDEIHVHARGENHVYVKK